MNEKERRLIDGKFDVNLNNGIATVKRTFEYEGATIEFTIGVKLLDDAATVTISDLHKRSVGEVIALLQRTLPKEK